MSEDPVDVSRVSPEMIGLPGVGKTTAIYQRLVEEGTGAVVVVERGFGAYADHPGELLHSIPVEDLPGNAFLFRFFRRYPIMQIEERNPIMKTGEGAPSPQRSV
jgi:hypothetical protein